MKPADKPMPLPVQMFASFGARQINLIKGVIAAIKDDSSVKAILWSKKLNELESTLVRLEVDAMELEECIDNPTRLLPEKQRAEVEKSPQQMAQVMLQFPRLTGETAERSRRTYTLLEYLGRKITDKRSTINLNRGLLISLVAIIIAVVAVAT